MSDVLIKKGTITLQLDRKDLIEILETGDGVVFNLKEGLQFILIDGDMPMHTKNIMKNSADSFRQNKIIFDLTNYDKPTMIDAT